MSQLAAIKKNVKKILAEIPQGVQVVAACKMRTSDEIQAAIDAGINIIGENHVQEAEAAFNKIEGQVKWHFIGHLQRNKVKRVIGKFDMIESLDSLRLARELDRECAKTGAVMDCLIEVNSGREEHKYGIMPEEVEKFTEKLKELKHIKVKGLMTMGPFIENADEVRPYFKTTKEIYDQLKDNDSEMCVMNYLSMGMSASYKVAIEEGANIVRIGTNIFGPKG